MGGMSLDNSHNTYLADSSMQFSPHSYFSTSFPSNKEMMTNGKDESVAFQTSNLCSSSKMNVNCQEGINGTYDLIHQ
jgi:hypothetical protein